MIDPANPPRRGGENTRYPVAGLFLALGAVGALAGGVIFSSALAGFAFFVLFAIAAMLWRRDEPPVLVFALGYQWLYVVASFLYSRIAGRFPGDTPRGNLSLTILLAVIGLLVLALGIRLGLWLFRSRMPGTLRRYESEIPRYNIIGLFWFTMALYTVNWFIEISPMRLFFNAAQILYSLLTIREVFFALLWLVILRQREGYGCGIVALLYALVPQFISTQSKFKELLFLFVVVLLIEWRPWSRLAAERARNARVLLASSALCAGLVFLGVVWEGAVKPNWRFAEVEGSPVGKLRALRDIVTDPVSRLDWGEGFEALVTRVDAAWPMSLVLVHVPDEVPHELGLLMRRSVMHVLMPRILFPDKPNLGSDSWLVARYAGLEVAGEEKGTSIGLGYLAEFYIDFGFWGMFLPAFGYGIVVGVFYGALLLRSGSYHIAHAVVIVPFLNHCLSFEGNFAKLLGGLIMNVVVLLAFLQFAGPWLHRYLSAESPTHTGRTRKKRGRVSRGSRNISSTVITS